ncbi:MAG: hypothetical protein WBD31_13950 [Rubripirellula sp.]
MTDGGASNRRLQHLEARFCGPESSPTDIPSWFSWAVDLGVSLSEARQPKKQHTAIVTAPCQSALCGVIAFGYLLRTLPESVASTDEPNLFQRFMNAEVGTEIKRLPRKGEKGVQRYRIVSHRHERNELGLYKLNGKRKGGGVYLTERTASEYLFSADEETEEGRSLAEYIGKSIVSEIPLTTDREINWHANQNEVVLAGPTAGNAVLRRHTDNIILHPRSTSDESDPDDPEAPEEILLSLSDLLSVREWQHERDCLPYLCRFANASRRDVPAIAEQAKIVFFNGIQSYLTFRDEFNAQDHVVVLSRDTAQSRMDRFLEATHEIRESYERDTCDLPAPPMGIQLMSLRDSQSEEAQW